MEFIQFKKRLLMPLSCQTTLLWFIVLYLLVTEWSGDVLCHDSISWEASVINSKHRISCKTVAEMYTSCPCVIAAALKLVKLKFSLPMNWQKPCCAWEEHIEKPGYSFGKPHKLCGSHEERRQFTLPLNWPKLCWVLEDHYKKHIYPSSKPHKPCET